MLILLSAAFLLSGVCAFIYETVWIYQFSRVFGSTVLAMSFVTATFFGGLALGSRWLGKASARSANRLRLYAYLELGIGIYALAFPLLLAGAEALYARAYPSLAGNSALTTLARLLLALAVMIVPTVLMGGTLPVLLAHFTDRLSALGRRAGLLYGVNALGAALGSFLSGYVLLKTLGVANTNALAGIVNVAVGVLAWVLARKIGPAPDSPAEQPVQTSAPAKTKLVVAAFAVSGFVSMSYEVFWLRYLTLYFSDTIYVYTSIIGFFVLGIALGSLLCACIISRIKSLLAFFGILQGGIGVLTAVAVYVPIRWVARIYDAGFEQHGTLIVAALLVPPALLMGATFPVVAKVIVSEVREVGPQVGLAYALNTLGCILGLLCSGFVLHSWLGMQTTLGVLFAANLLLAALLMLFEARPRWRVLAVVPALAAAAGIWAMQISRVHLPQAVFCRRPGQELLEVREGAVGISWTLRDTATNEVQLWDTNVRISRGGRSSFLAQGYIPMLIAPEIPRDVLGLAFGAGMSCCATRDFPEVRRLDFVDISRENIELALKHFPENAGLRDDPRASFIVDDAYSYAKYARTQYDLVLMEPTPPHYGFHNASVYTKEFYELVQQRLASGGMFVQVFSVADFSLDELRGVLRTFGVVFEHCLLWRKGWDVLLIGSREPFCFDAQAIRERLKRQVIQDGLRQRAPSITLESLLADLLIAGEDFRKAGEGGAIYTDDKSALRFTSGHSQGRENLRHIEAHRSSAEELRGLFGR
jgi:spermidine synthase